MVPTKEHWKILGYFSAFELVLMRLPLGRGSRPGIARGQRPKIRRQRVCIIHYHTRTFVAGVEMGWWKAQY